MHQSDVSVIGKELLGVSVCQQASCVQDILDSSLRSTPTLKGVVLNKCGLLQVPRS